MHPAALLAAAVVVAVALPGLYSRIARFKWFKSRFGFHTNEDHTDWSYDQQDRWPGACRTGQRQSPIAIQTKRTVREDIPELRFYNYEQVGPLIIAANIHTVGVNGFMNSTWINRQPYIEGGGLSGRYHLEQIHLHWNKRGNGSEHTLDGRRYPAEVHLVHSKDGVHPASDAPDKFAVVAVLLEEGEDANQPLDEPFFSRLRHILVVPEEVDGVITPTDLRAEAFLPANRTNFYRYDGSLTTPNCDEDVVWTIMQDTVKVSKDQLDELRKVVMQEDNPFKNNTRPAHALSGRKILRNF